MTQEFEAINEETNRKMEPLQRVETILYQL